MLGSHPIASHPDLVNVQDIVIIVTGITNGAGTDGPVRRTKSGRKEKKRNKIERGMDEWSLYMYTCVCVCFLLRQFPSVCDIVKADFNKDNNVNIQVESFLIFLIYIYTVR